MSNALAIAAVTAAFKDLLNDGLLNHDLSSIGSFSVTATPPDRISTGATEPNQLNVFLYQVTSNVGWRNELLPARAANGARISNPPLAIDLHYLLSAYGSQDLNAEVLLGYAMQLLHETPVFTRNQLRTVLGAPSPIDGSILPSPFGSLSAAALAEQVEMLKITPVFLTSEELSKLWTAMQARYRPSMAYLVSVLLIQSDAPARSAPPVLKRGPADRGPTALASGNATLSRIEPAASELLPALRLGDDLRVFGSAFDSGTVTVCFENVRLGVLRELSPVDATPTRMTVHLPAVAEDASAMDGWGIGLYQVSLRVERPNVPTWRSNAVPMALSPLISISPLAGAAGDLTLVIDCTPRLHASQHSAARLIFGNREVIADSISTPADTTKPTQLKFKVKDATAGKHVIRLRIDGVDSLPVIVSGTPATFEFDPQQTVTVS